jgi:hypothetical protein
MTTRPNVSDSVDLVWAWEKSFGVQVTQRDADKMLRVRDAIDVFAAKLSASGTRSACLTLRAFNRFRSVLTSAGVARCRITPSARLRDILPRAMRRDAWKRVRGTPEFSQLPRLRFGIGWCFAPITVADAFYAALAYSAHSLRPPRAPWTRAEVRQVIRAGIREIAGLTDYSDDAEIVRELGID